ncbi:hypothetical protein CYL20_07340 [Pseudomonas palleroniana]|uniref:Uncharacterized protein n=1 Tax=Pseudomonas palleroniana TaxID=191390 RepID=A0A2L1J774_9PSED|nr:hypothetical protein [Pseudomonas palleroniana]AVE04364.1 hypothetical protein CYL20_07340 [Pseudomonas palleroniana]
MDDQFYLQDSRNHAYVGDGLSFWGFGGSGYVTDLAKAQVFTWGGARDHRDTDIPWPNAWGPGRVCEFVLDWYGTKLDVSHWARDWAPIWSAIAKAVDILDAKALQPVGAVIVRMDGRQHDGW